MSDAADKESQPDIHHPPVPIEQIKAELKEAPSSFIDAEIDQDLAAGRYSRPMCTRFPPEPNGLLHIGHTKGLMVNYSAARQRDGKFVLRFDDTNPAKERQEFVDAAIEDVQWLGIEIDAVHYSSDYGEELYKFAKQLTQSGDAFVCDLSPEEFKEYRGDYHTPGRPSPYRDRSIEENLDLLERMKAGEFKPGDRTLRAKVDYNSPNMVMRDPVIYRIMDEEHYRHGNTWKIYPGYDFAQGYSDYLDGVTHSLCSLEFVINRPLYDWFLEKVNVPEPPRQIEFGKLLIEGAVLGKRNIQKLIDEGVLKDWDDPRVFTLRALRRRGFPAAAIRQFLVGAGVSNTNSTVSMSAFEHVVREHLNRTSPRRMAVLKPVKLILENLDKEVEIELPHDPQDPAAGSRTVKLERELYIDADDFLEDPPRKYFRLSPGKEVRLRNAYVVKCVGFEKDPSSGVVTEIRATCDLETLGQHPPDGRKVKGVIQWVPAATGVDIEVRMYDRLVNSDDSLNRDSLTVYQAKGEPALAETDIGDRVQFERVGYFCVDRDTTPKRYVYNLTVTLKDKWSSIKKRGAKPA